MASNTSPSCDATVAGANRARAVSRARSPIAQRSAGLFTSVPIASALGVLSTAQLFVVAAVYGLLYMTSVAGIPSLIPDLVSEDELTTANAME